MDSDPDRTNSCYLVPYTLSKDITNDVSKSTKSRLKKKKHSLKSSKSMMSVALQPIVSRSESEPDLKSKSKSSPKSKRSQKHKESKSIKKVQSMLLTKDWRYSLCLPLYEQVSFHSASRKKKIFPHFGSKHGQFLNHPLKPLGLLSTVTANGGTDTVFLGKVLRQYLADKSSFRSLTDFAVLKLNELHAISRGTRIPNRVRTAICCDLLESVIASDSTLSSNVVLERLKIELYRSIYGDNDFIVNETTIKSRSKCAPPRHYMADTKAFFQQKPYFLRFNKLLKHCQRNGLCLSSKQQNRTNNNDENRNHDQLQGDNGGGGGGRTLESITESALNRRHGGGYYAKKSSGAQSKHAKLESAELLSHTFLGWRDFVTDSQRLHHGLSLKMEHNKSRQRLRLKRLHFRDWKSTVFRKRLKELKAKSVALEQRHDEALRSSILLIQKNHVLQFEINALKTRMISGSGLGADGGSKQKMRINAQSHWSEVRVFQMELKVLGEKLAICRRELVELQSDDELVYCSVLLSPQEMRDRVDVMSLSEEEMVIRWINYQLLQIHEAHSVQIEDGTASLPRSVSNFGPDLANCAVILLLLHRVRGDDYLDFNKLAKCFAPSKRKEICQITVHELHEFLGEGLVLHRDLMQNRNDILFSLIINVMHHRPALHFNESTSAISSIYAEIDMAVKRISYHIIPNQMENLKALMLRSETILNKAENFKKGVLTADTTWRRVLNRLQLKVINIYAQRRIGSSMLVRNVRGGGEVEAESQWLPFSKLRHLLRDPLDDDLDHDHSGDNGSDQEQQQQSVRHNRGSDTDRMKRDLNELRRCESVLNRHHHGILESFRFYSSQDADSGLFSSDEAKIWVKDIRLNQNKMVINESTIKRIITFCELPIDHYLRYIAFTEKKAKSAALQSMATQCRVRGELNLLQFMEWIFRISLKMTSKLRLTASEKLEFVLNHHVIRYGQSGNELRDRIESKSMTKMLSNLQRYLYEGFCYFATSNSKASGGSSAGELYNEYVPLLKIDGFMAMLEELQLIGSSLTKSTIKSIFRRALYQDEKQYVPPFAITNVHGQRSQPITNHSLLHYDAFIECLVVVAIHKKPDPYLSLETRVEEFLVHSVIDPLFQQNKISIPYKPKKIQSAIKRNSKRRKSTKRQSKKRRKPSSSTGGVMIMRTKKKKK